MVIKPRSFLSPATTTVEDLLNAINASGTAVRAQINASGTGIDILNPTQGPQMTIAENGGTTASDLGVRSLGPATQLSELNDGKGVRTCRQRTRFPDHPHRRHQLFSFDSPAQKPFRT